LVTLVRAGVCYFQEGGGGSASVRSVSRYATNGVRGRFVVLPGAPTPQPAPVHCGKPWDGVWRVARYPHPQTPHPSTANGTLQEAPTFTPHTLNGNLNRTPSTRTVNAEALVHSTRDCTSEWSAGGTSEIGCCLST